MWGVPGGPLARPFEGHRQGQKSALERVSGLRSSARLGGSSHRATRLRLASITIRLHRAALTAELER